MEVAIVQRPGSLDIVERPVPEPGRGEVRVRVVACGVCHSDSLTVENQWPGIAFPRAPGHEIAGVVDKLGEDVTTSSVGDRVGVGWFGGNDYTCRSCRRGDFLMCDNLRVPGIAYDGGYAEYVVVLANVLAPIPEALTFEEAAPLMCAGVTTFNALRHSGALPGDLVAVQGIGGLGHLGIQFAAKMGFEVVAVARGADKAPLAREFGAHDYIDSAASNAAEMLARRGGAKTIVSTVTSTAAMAPLIGGLGVDGTFVVLGVSPEPLPIPVLAMIGKRQAVRGWPSGTSADSADTLRFCALTGVRPRIERFPRARAADGYARMMSGDARFRVVLTAQR